MDALFCSSSFLIYRYVVDPDQCFCEGMKPYTFNAPSRVYPILNVDDIHVAIQTYIEEILSQGGNIGLALSGGIDSAILARYVPKDTVAYTFRCLAPQSVDESNQAAVYAKECGLAHKIVDITWKDYMSCVDVLMMHKGAPIHSIEPQIYMGALQAKKDGVTHFLFGENADIIFGGMDGLLAKDWKYEEFIERYTYLNPEKVLKKGKMITEPFERYKSGDYIDSYGFICDYFYTEANGSYDNACTTAGLHYASPFNRMRLQKKLDLARIRSGESKYMLRELFQRLYPNLEIPAKLPMPRAVKQWLASWQGPVRPEFIHGCADQLNGDKRWMMYILERFLNLVEYGKQKNT